MDSNLHNHYSSHPQQQQIQQQLQHHHHHHHNISSGMYGDEDVAPLFSPPVSRFSDVSSHRILGRIRGNESHFMNSKGIVHNNNNNNSMAPATNSLRRQSSSPAGFFENMDNGGYSVMGSVDKFGLVNGGVTHDSLLSSTNRLKMPMAFSTGLQSSSRLLSRIDEQNEGEIYGVTGLTHQLSLPTSSTELSAMENLLQFQDNVPLRSRAKRGCATHPRSIAERVRRTRISERMKKLQDLVPNMDKQTSISDMLDLAVDYIKNLQKEVETLADHHAKCRCPNKKKI